MITNNYLVTNHIEHGQPKQWEKVKKIINNQFCGLKLISKESFNFQVLKYMKITMEDRLLRSKPS
jgi:hypothetical protein